MNYLVVLWQLSFTQNPFEDSHNQKAMNNLVVILTIVILHQPIWGLTPTTSVELFGCPVTIHFPQVHLRNHTNHNNRPWIIWLSCDNFHFPQTHLRTHTNHNHRPWIIWLSCDNCHLPKTHLRTHTIQKPWIIRLFFYNCHFALTHMMTHISHKPWIQ